MDEIKNLTDFLTKLFTPSQQAALVIITLCVMASTQAFKNIYFGFFPERRTARKVAIIWLFAVCAGIAGGIVGHYTGSPRQPMWFWIVTGVLSGGAAIGLFKIIIEIMWPRLTGMFKKS